MLPVVDAQHGLSVDVDETIMNLITNYLQIKKTTLTPKLPPMGRLFDVIDVG